MSLSRNCERCQQPLPEQLSDGTCPSCGFASGRERETPRGSATPDDRDGKFELGSDPNPTGIHIPSTIHEEPTFKKFPTYYPDIPNHTDFELVGRGGMGTVYRAIQRPTDRKVAVKVMNAFAVDSPQRERFINEVRAHARIQHAGIIPIYEVGDCSHGPYFTMEYQPGGTLAQRLKDGKLDDREAVRMIADAAEAVHAAHSLGIIHRDLKPSNILVDPEGRVRVTDFGLAKHTTENNDLTEKGVIVGTFAYMSPEQAKGDPAKIGKESDIYCLGSSLYQLLTGQVAHKQLATSRAMVQSILDNPTPAPSKIRLDLCPNLDAAIQKCMASNPAERYATAEAFAQDLRNWLAGEPMLARPLTRGQKVRRYLHRHRAAVAAAIMFPFLVAAAFVVKREMDPKRQIEVALARGEKVVLVDRIGLPKWFHWDFNEVPMTTDVIGDGSAGFQTQIESYVRLVDDPGHESYLVEMELRHVERSGKGRSLVGFYFGLNNESTNGGIPFSRLIAVHFSDFYDLIEAKSQQAKNLHRVWVQDLWVPRGLDQNSPITFTPHRQQDQPLYFTAKNDSTIQNVWRKLTLDISPHGFTVKFHLDNDRALASHFTAEAIDRSLAASLPERTTPNGVELRPQPWNSRRPLGILAKDATVAFRNVTIEPK